MARLKTLWTYNWLSTKGEKVVLDAGTIMESIPNPTDDNLINVHYKEHEFVIHIYNIEELFEEIRSYKVRNLPSWW